ncbi:ABC transporter ATP-binding protein/permease [Streptomyces nojiriensis]|uniref:ABC transporter ATP-binding protein n=1 Tax=Streptomyces nojiriensis TaxID=66374 RepID=UPI002E191CB2
MSHSSAADPAFTTPASARALLTRGLARNRRQVAASFALLSVWQLSEAMVSVVVGELIDHAVATGDVTALAEWGALLMLVFASLMFVYRSGAVIAYRIDQRESNRLRAEIAHHVLRPRGARTGMLPGETLSLATSDTESVGSLAQSAGYTFASAMAVAVSAVALLRIDIVIGLTVLLGIPAVLAVTQTITPLISRHSRDQQARNAATSGTAADLVRGLRAVKGIRAENEAVARYRRHSQVAKAAGIRLAASQAVMESLSTGLSGLFLAGVTLLAGSRALDHTLTIGQLIAIVGLTQFLGGPIQALGRVGARVAAGHASASRIVDFLRTPPLLAAGALQPSQAVAELSLQEVNTGALRGLSLTSRPGELLCLVTDDPAAAGSLVGLLAGETPAEDMTGDVLLSQEPLTGLGVEVRRRLLLVNPHQTDLLQGTLRGNIDPDERHEDAAVARFLDAAAAHDILRLHEQGLDQPVTAKGTTYSGGQRQRIALARALAAEAPILVLDNPTTAVDAVTEHRIAVGIRALRHGAPRSRTTWIVTTSPALLAQADRVIHVENGRVAGSGTHRELLGRPAYAELVLR